MSACVTVDGSRFSCSSCLVTVNNFLGLKILFWDLVTTWYLPLWLGTCKGGKGCEGELLPDDDVERDSRRGCCSSAGTSASIGGLGDVSDGWLDSVGVGTELWELEIIVCSVGSMGGI